MHQCSRPNVPQNRNTIGRPRVYVYQPKRVGARRVAVKRVTVQFPCFYPLPQNVQVLRQKADLGAERVAPGVAQAQGAMPRRLRRRRHRRVEPAQRHRRP
jgi:hypothetical protein